MLRKKFLSLLTVFTMLTSLIPAFTLTASAAEEAKYQLSENGEWQTGSLKEAVENVYDGGTIEVLSDIELTERITISKSLTITSYDKTNPCKISHNITDSSDDYTSQMVGYGMLFDANSGNFNLENIILDGENKVVYHPLVYILGANMTLKNGAVIQNAHSKNNGHVGGAAICVRRGNLIMEEGSKITSCQYEVGNGGGGVEVNSEINVSEPADFTMNGGSIENCKAKAGGGVYVNAGTFHLKGGEIKNNIATDSTFNYGGGGIYVNGVSWADHLATAIAYIEGGSVTGNKSYSYGGGVCVHHSKGILEISGGVISGNLASIGAGVAGVLGNIWLYGGEITGNMALYYAGGVYCGPNDPQDGLCCFITIKKEPKVTNNVTNNEPNNIPDNLYLDGNDEGVEDISSPVTIIGELGDNACLNMSRWTLPNDTTCPGKITFIPYETESKQYTITKDDLAKIHTDNEQYGFILHEGKIKMVLAVDVTLDKTELTFTGDHPYTQQLTATVTPDNSIIKDVTWSSSNEAVAIVDENGVVTPTGNGECTITATTVSPYNATASCDVTIDLPLYNLSAEAVHGTVSFTTDSSVIEDTQVTLSMTPDEGYELKSITAHKDGDETIIVDIDEENRIVMPPYDIIAIAEFEPIEYSITYELNEGTLPDGKTNPEFYTVESEEITLNNPTRTDYSFKGWTGTDLAEASLETVIPAGSTGDRSYTAVWEINKSTVTFNANGGKWDNGDKTTTVSNVSYNSTVGENMPGNPERDGFIFKGWFTEAEGDEKFTKDTAVFNNITVYAHWEEIPKPSASPSVTPTVSPNATPSVSPSITPTVSPSVSPSASPSATPSASPSATPTSKPRRRGGSSIKTTPTPKPTATPAPDSTPTAVPSVSDTQTAEHLPYIVGYPDGEFKPDNSISRAEVAAILARLTDNFDESGKYKSAFPDIISGAWYENYVGFEENKNIIVGYPDGEFKPDRFITRAEFAAMIARYTQLDCTDSSDYPFSDIKQWAYAQVAACYKKGYIEGYEDNTFRPEAYITRAEAVTIINRVIDRVPYDISVNNCVPRVYENIFADMTKNHWGYYNVMEAAIRHNAEDFH